MFVGGLLGVASVIGMYFYLKPDLPSVEVLRDVQLQTPMRIYTKDGKLISQYGVKRRIPVSLDDVPETLVQAVIATEDSRFYEHYGIDPIGVARAALNLVVTGEKGQGASTLTMQVARNFFLDRRKEFTRKIKELFIAIHMEQELSKREILELYLNKMELGHRAFGVGAAAQVYYGKTLKELNLAQLATVAGLYQAPSRLNPISNPEASKKRRRIVLLRMLDEGYITRQQFDEAAAAPVTASRHGAEIEVNAPYLADIIYNEMVEIYGKDIAENSGFKVYAAATSEHQEAAQTAVIKNLHDYDERHGYRGPIRAIWTPLEAIPKEDLAEFQIVLPELQPEVVAEPDTQELADSSETVEQVAVNTDNEIDIPDDVMQKLIDAFGPVAAPDEQTMQDILLETGKLDGLEPAIVVQVNDKDVVVRTLEQAELTIDWDGLDWARPYINDYNQGPEPEVASDILSVGMLIYVRQLEDNSWKLSQLPDVSGAFVALDPFDGAVQAVVGGYSFYQTQFNRATQAKRQVGSNIKPFIYSAALDNGYTLASIINDAPINQWDASTGVAWRPQNSPAIYDGPIRMRVALGKSKNVVSVRLLRGVGLDETRNYITRFGFLRDEIPRDETMSLGSGSHTPLEVATAMAIIANGGFAVQPYFIDRIDNEEDETVWQVEPLYACDPCNEEEQVQEIEAVSDENQDLEALLAAELSALEPVVESEPEKVRQSAPRVLSQQTAFLVRQMLRTAVRANGNWANKTYWLGTGWRARNLLNQRTDIGGKTGTTNDARDTWFTGFAPDLVATAWVGFDDNNRQLGRATRNQNLINKNPEKFNWIGNALIGAEDGAKAAQPAWIYFMQTVLADVPEQGYTQPEGIIRVRIDRRTGKLTTRTDASSMFEYFLKGTEPTTYVTESELSLPVDNEEQQEPDEELDELSIDDIF
ncbi:penicillin-binding protein 1A [Glaciecola sp. 1036]|uniref:penicillin-binding protein 1A n=1 Tax=Alteromonadaceae TaxID=72275 RepID=UPI003D03E0A6